jgi:hypothetical protein
LEIKFPKDCEADCEEGDTVQLSHIVAKVEIGLTFLVMSGENS